MTNTTQNSDKEKPLEEMKVEAKEQLRLASEYYQQGNFKDVIEALNKIPVEATELYAKAQFNLGVIYRRQGNFDQAIETYNNVPSEVAELYAKAQFNLGLLYDIQRNIKEAIKAYKRVSSKVIEQYSIAQFNLGVIYDDQKQFDKAIIAYKAVDDKVSELYEKAQVNLGVIYCKQAQFELAVEVLEKVSGFPEVHRAAELIIRIINKATCKKELLNIFEVISALLGQLYINQNPFLGKVEQNIAHYTRPSTAFRMLENQKDLDNKSSPFRLSSTLGVNDPTEGDVLFKWLGLAPSKENNLITFISCFTFNHDSLNQFRLYGKENNEEASGVSLVFNNTFFAEESDISRSILTSLTHRENAENTNKENNKDENKLPLYRCIYLDLDSDYISVASREEITFYREKTSNLNFDKYQQEINRLKSEIKSKLEDLREAIKEINPQLTENDKQILEEILLPLRYLVKHAAFEEEQEARIFRIYSLFDEQIKTNEDHSQMYIEYDVNVKSAIHKVYLSPGAEKYKEHFIKCLDDRERKKVVISSNPFRNKKY